MGHAPVVALLLATPGVDPLARNIVSGAEAAQGRACLPAPRPSPLLQEGSSPLDYAQILGHASSAALLRADPRVAAALAAAGAKA